VGLAESEKSAGRFTVKLASAECDSAPDVPVTVIVYVPAGVELEVETVSVEVAVDPLVRVTLEGFSVDARPWETTGETAVPRLTVPAKPFMLEIVTV